VTLASSGGLGLLLMNDRSRRKLAATDCGWDWGLGHADNLTAPEIDDSFGKRCWSRPIQGC